MTGIHRCLVTVVLFASLVACSKQGHDGDDGGGETGGSTLTGDVPLGGAGGGGGGGVTTKGFTRFDQLPCLDALISSCGTDGACQGAWNSSETQWNACFDSGARGVTERIVNDCDRRTETRVYKPDGSLCYTFRADCSCMFACEQGDYSWLDPAGKLVATGHWNWNDSTVSCTNGPGTCTNSERAMDLHSCVPSTAPFTSSCALGDCS